jgi:hypothetical protein
MSIGNNQALDSGIARGSSERIESSNFFNIAPQTEALQVDAYKGLGHPSESGNVKQSDGFLAGMERAIDSIPEDIHGSQRAMIGGDFNQSAFKSEPAKDGKVEVADFKEADNEMARKHAGMMALGWGFGDGRAGGDMYGMNPSAEKQKINQLADGIVLKHVNNA